MVIPAVEWGKKGKHFQFLGFNFFFDNRLIGEKLTALTTSGGSRILCWEGQKMKARSKKKKKKNSFKIVEKWDNFGYIVF